MSQLSKRNLLVRLLDSTNSGKVNLSIVRESIRMTDDSFASLVKMLVDEGLVTLVDDIVSLNLEQRLSAATEAIHLGADVETVSRFLGWLEFEELVASIYDRNNFRTFRRFRFQAEGRRWEIDILAIKSPWLLLTECKHYGKGLGDSIARKVIEIHIEKSEVFRRALPRIVDRIGIKSWKRAIVLPTALTLSRTPMEIYRRVPAVSVIALPRFIEEFDGQLERLTHWIVDLPEKKLEPIQMRFSQPTGSKRAPR